MDVSTVTLLLAAVGKRAVELVSCKIVRGERAHPRGNGTRQLVIVSPDVGKLRIAGESGRQTTSEVIVLKIKLGDVGQVKDGSSQISAIIHHSSQLIITDINHLSVGHIHHRGWQSSAQSIAVHLEKLQLRHAVEHIGNGTSERVLLDLKVKQVGPVPDPIQVSREQVVFQVKSCERKVGNRSWDGTSQFVALQKQTHQCREA